MSDDSHTCDYGRLRARQACILHPIRRMSEARADEVVLVPCAVLLANFILTAESGLSLGPER